MEKSFFNLDFFTQRAQDWWAKWITDFRRVNVSFDGLWIDMNEPGKDDLFPNEFLYDNSISFIRYK
jgi:alpha-glucosidase (family GH31 glycosyl hydrolase)